MAAKQNVSAGPIGVQSPARVRTVPPGPARNQVPQTGITGSQIANDAVDSEHYAAASIDREHMNEEASPITRWAPDFDLRLSPAGTTVHYVQDTWAPTSNDHTIGVTLIQDAYPTATTTFLGKISTGYLGLRVGTTGVITLIEAGVTLATSAAGAFLIDREPHRYAISISGTAITVTRDGASLLTGTRTVAISAVASGFIFGMSANAAGANIVYDCELTDPAAATNNVFLRMDRPGQLCLNACSDPSDPLYSANTTNLGGSITSTPSSTGRPRPTLVTTYRAGARPATRNEANNPTRMAAYSGLGAASTDGYWASIAHVPTATASYDISFDYTGNVLPSATAYAVGSSFNGPRFSLGTDGAISLTYITTGVASGATVTKVVDGRTHRIRATMVQNGANVDGALYIDGRFVASGSTAGTITSGNFFIGAGGTAQQRCPGAITNVRILDVTTPANSIELLMDEPSGNFTNIYPGAAGSAVRRGYVPMRSIPSTDGRGMPWVGNQGALRYGARLLADAAGITGVTSYSLTGLTEDERDPTGHYAAGVFTAPCAGVATFYLAASIAATTLAGADNIRMVCTHSAASDVWEAKVTLPVVDQYVSLSCGGVVSMAAAETLSGTLQSLLVGDVYTLALGSSFVIEFTPTPVAG